MSPRHPVRAVALVAVAAVASAGLLAAPAHAEPPADAGTETVRVATYNLSLNRNFEGQLVADLSTPDNAQAKTVAEIIQRTDPDIVLLNEFDYVEDDVAVTLFRENYLEVPQNGAEPVDYPYWYVAPSNTGISRWFASSDRYSAVLMKSTPTTC